MANVPQIVKIGISLKMLPNNTAVYFKSDGTRFGQTRTIKLLTGSKYKIEVVVKPGAVEATSMSVGGVTFPLEQQSKDPQSVVYTGLYDTEGVAHTKSGERQPVQVSIQAWELKGTAQYLSCSLLRSSGQRSWMLFLGSAGATHLAWESLHLVLRLPLGPLLPSPSTSSRALL
uniref:CB1 cannabinoid receptor-interacting protein 1 n=1 Tax=Astatotilapia calliptera TaxID=8154 RepID=A0A3P8RCE6_ASTCA